MSKPSHPAGLSQKDKNVSQIVNPRRLLILTPDTESHVTIPPFLHRLTGVAITPQQHPPSYHSNVKNKEADSTTTAAAGTPPSPFAGYTTHAPLQLQTKYYTAEIPIWVDEIPAPSSQLPSTSTSTSTPADLNPDAWKNEFLSPEAQEVRDAIGAIIVCIQKPPCTVNPSRPLPTGLTDADRERDGILRDSINRVKEVVQAVAEVKGQTEEERGGVGDVPGVVVLVGKEADSDSRRVGEDADIGGGDGDGTGEFGVMWWDEEINDGGIGAGVEIVSWDPKESEEELNGRKGRRNEFGELLGIERVMEVLETNAWSSGGHEDLDGSISDSLDDYGEFIDGFSLEANQLEREMTGLKLAINKGGNEGDEEGDEGITEDDLKVEQLEGLMMRVQAIRDMSADLPDAERKSFAAKAIKDIMKDV